MFSLSDSVVDLQRLCLTGDAIARVLGHQFFNRPAGEAVTSFASSLSAVGRNVLPLSGHSVLPSPWRLLVGLTGGRFFARPDDRMAPRAAAVRDGRRPPRACAACSVPFAGHVRQPGGESPPVQSDGGEIRVNCKGPSEGMKDEAIRKIVLISAIVHGSSLGMSLTP